MSDFDRKSYNRAYYLANKERICANVARWQKDNREKVRGYQRKWDEANSERNKEYYIENRERIKDRVRLYTEKNSGRSFILRRVWAGEVRKEAIPPWLTNAQKEAIQWFYDEARRLTQETGIRHVVDHIHRLNGAHYCGLHVPWNLQVITDSANKSKRFKENVD